MSEVKFLISFCGLQLENSEPEVAGIGVNSVSVTRSWVSRPVTSSCVSRPVGALRLSGNSSACLKNEDVY